MKNPLWKQKPQICFDYHFIILMLLNRTLMKQTKSLVMERYALGFQILSLFNEFVGFLVATELPRRILNWFFFFNFPSASRKLTIETLIEESETKVFNKVDSCYRKNFTNIGLSDFLALKGTHYNNKIKRCSIVESACKKSLFVEVLLEDSKPTDMENWKFEKTSIFENNFWNYWTRRTWW